MTEQVPVQVCRMVAEAQVRQVPVQMCRMVQEECVRKVPVQTCRQVVERVPRQEAVQVCRMVMRRASSPSAGNDLPHGRRGKSRAVPSACVQMGLREANDPSAAHGYETSARDVHVPRTANGNGARAGDTRARAEDRLASQAQNLRAARVFERLFFPPLPTLSALSR